MKRYLSIWLPDWPLDRLHRTRHMFNPPPQRPTNSKPDSTNQPFVLVEPGVHGLLVVAANKAAEALGICEGLSFTDARARAPSLAHDEIDRDADTAALNALAHWLMNWTPLVALDGPNGIFLETTGCDHLHNGEAPMAEKLSNKLGLGGFTHSLAIADTPTAASALARGTNDKITLLASGKQRDALKNLPIWALRLSPDVCQLLRRFGLTRIGQLYGISRKALARRFKSFQKTDYVLEKLDQALGTLPEPLEYLEPPPSYTKRLSCPDPLITSEALNEGLSRLLDSLCTDLEAQGIGAQGFTLRAFRADRTASWVSISMARPSRTPAHIAHLFKERIDEIEPGLGIDILQLEASRTSTLSETTQTLSEDFVDTTTNEAGLAALADRLTAKLGDNCVQITHTLESHAPERRERASPYKGVLPGWDCTRPEAPPRPLRLFDRPEAVRVLAEIPDGPPLHFIWRRVSRQVARTDGPERIAPEWWALPQQRLRTRDYYRVEDTSGRRYWIFREGLYGDTQGGPPNWFVHGLFP